MVYSVAGTLQCAKPYTEEESTLDVNCFSPSLAGRV